MKEARFPHVAPGAGHYESWFVKAHHPTAPQAFWLRHTVHQRPGEPRTASLWLTLFDAQADEPVRAGKLTVADVAVPAGGAYVAIAGATIGGDGGRGALHSPTLDAEWDFTFASVEPEQRHLPYAWMYDARLPRTKSATPHPGVVFAGRLGPFADLSGWRGLVSHNWGSEHAERWIWTHASLDAPGAHGSEHGWMELVLGRIRVAGRTLPWIANGALSLDGTRHVLGGLDRIRSTRVEETATGARFVVTGADVRVEAEVRARPEHLVVWRYADPDGPEHHSAHSSICDLRLDVRRDGRPAVTLQAATSASYELGMRETDHGLPVQPYVDGRL